MVSILLVKGRLTNVYTIYTERKSETLPSIRIKYLYIYYLFIRIHFNELTVNGKKKFNYEQGILTNRNYIGASWIKCF